MLYLMWRQVLFLLAVERIVQNKTLGSDLECPIPEERYLDIVPLSRVRWLWREFQSPKG